MHITSLFPLFQYHAVCCMRVTRHTHLLQAFETVLKSLQVTHLFFGRHVFPVSLYPKTHTKNSFPDTFFSSVGFHRPGNPPLMKFQSRVFLGFQRERRPRFPRFHSAVVTPPTVTTSRRHFFYYVLPVLRSFLSSQWGGAEAELWLNSEVVGSGQMREQVILDLGSTGFNVCIHSVAQIMALLSCGRVSLPHGGANGDWTIQRSQ